MNGAARFNWTGWSVFAAVLLLWEFLSRVDPTLEIYVPPVSRIAAALVELARSGQAAVHLLATLSRFLQGYFLAALLAVSLGILLGHFRFAHAVAAMLIEFLRPMPSVAIIPVAILALGINDKMIVAVTVYASFWPILINTIDGVRHIEPILLQTGRTFGLGQGRILIRIVLPAASAYIVTGLRISLSIALILVTTAEMLAGSRGLGFFILDQERSFNGDRMYAGIAVVAALGYLLNRSFLVLEGRLLGWRRGLIGGDGVG